MAKLLVKFDDGVSVMDLLTICSMEKMHIKTKVFVGSTEVKSAIVDNENGEIHLCRNSNPVSNEEEYTKLSFIREV